MRSRCLLFILVFCLLFTAPALAAGRIIVRVPSGVRLLSTLCGLVGCNIVGSLDGTIGDLFLVTVPDGSVTRILNLLLSLPGVASAELDLQISIPLLAPGAPPASLSNQTFVSYFGDRVMSGYVNQPASQIIRVRQAQSSFNVAGAGIVAVIDTGVDPHHAALQRVLLPGYDFTQNSAGGSEMAGVTQSTAAVVDGGAPLPVGPAVLALLGGLDPVTLTLLNTPPYTAFGHGTMVCGIVHLVAPRALIMPLRAFQSNGTGYLSDVIRAIYYAVQNQADIVNMSFNTPANSAELARAVAYAIQKDVVIVAAAGNEGAKVLTYPASNKLVIGVGSTTNNDQRSWFTNYGSQVVWVAAPGEGIVSTYPFSTYSAGWGTSFSAPFVSGTAGLLRQLKAGLDQQEARGAVAHAKELSSSLGLGEGRLDVYRAVKSIQ